MVVIGGGGEDEEGEEEDVFRSRRAVAAVAAAPLPASARAVRHRNRFFFHDMTAPSFAKTPEEEEAEEEGRADGLQL